MEFKNFRLLVILRVLLLTTALTLLAWCIANVLYLRSIYIAVGAVIVLFELLWYISKFNRDIKTLLTSILQKDFTTHFQTQGNGKNFDELYELLNKISESFRTISSQKEIQHRYFEMLFEHVRVSILSVDAAGKVEHANQALKDLFQVTVINNLNSFDSIDSSFTDTLRKISTGETRLIKLRVNQDLLQLSIHASEFKLDGKYHKLISMQNIRNELDTREMEAWQKLIKVLSHEIMNSVAPIMSLSSTLHGLIDQTSFKDQNSNLYESLDKGLEAIKIRSEGLYNFTQTYRRLTGVPQIHLKQCNLKEIIGRVETLMQTKLRESNIKLIISNIDAPIVVDPELMEHVLINLLVNAIEALGGKENALIKISSTQSQKGNTQIHVIDNGEGMDESTIEKIFIPFFTTKKHGSGIGLALIKQILQLHQADIQVKSELGKGTEFMITL